MLKITVIEDSRNRRLILEGKLLAPWTIELIAAYQAAGTDLQARELVVDLRGLTAISPEGEEILLDLMREQVKFQCGVYMKEVLRQLARRSRARERDNVDE